MSQSNFIIPGCELIGPKEYRRVKDTDMSSLNICLDPRLNPPGHLILGMWRHCEYQNMVLDQAGAEALIAKLQEHFGLNKG